MNAEIDNENSNEENVMALTLYEQYSQEEVSSWCIDDPEISDTAFSAWPTKEGLICLAQIGPAPSHYDQMRTSSYPFIFSPTKFCWCPSEKWVAAPGHVDPEGVFYKHSRRIRLLVSQSIPGQWCFVGDGTLTVTAVTAGVKWQYGFSLAPKLKRELWIAMGGYEEWLLVLGSQEYRHSREADLQTLIHHDWGTVAPDIEVFRYEGDEFLAVTDNNNLAIVYYHNNGCELCSHNPDYAGDPHEHVFFQRPAQPEVEISAAAVIPRATATQLVETYLRTGKPTGLVNIWSVTPP